MAESDTYYGKEHGLLHVCEDGHEWVEQPDGGVSPSWGYGLTSIKYEQGPKLCPEPQRGYSAYEDGGPTHGYQCPSCGRVHYIGGCLPGVRFDPWAAPDPPCDPPVPVCCKPPVKTLTWRERDDRAGIELAGWFDPENPEVGEQLGLL